MMVGRNEMRALNKSYYIIVLDLNFFFFHMRTLVHDKHLKEENIMWEPLRFEKANAQSVSIVLLTGTR